jgi:hypothetical protein
MDLASSQQGEFRAIVKRTEFIESEYNKLSKIVHIKDLELKNAKELLECGEVDRNKYVQDLKKYFLQFFGP